MVTVGFTVCRSSDSLVVKIHSAVFDLVYTEYFFCLSLRSEDRCAVDLQTNLSFSFPLIIYSSKMNMVTLEI